MLPSILVAIWPSLYYLLSHHCLPFLLLRAEHVAVDSPFPPPASAAATDMDGGLFLTYTACCLTTVLLFSCAFFIASLTWCYLPVDILDRNLPRSHVMCFAADTPRSPCCLDDNDTHSTYSFGRGLPCYYRRAYLPSWLTVRSSQRFNMPRLLYTAVSAPAPLAVPVQPRQHPPTPAFPPTNRRFGYAYLAPRSPICNRINKPTAVIPGFAVFLRYFCGCRSCSHSTSAYDICSSPCT